MDLKIRGEIIHVSHKLKEDELYSIRKSDKSQSLKIYKKPQIVKGFSNVCEDLNGILIIDYDCVDKSIVLEDYELIQEKFKLPPAYLFRTKKQNYHVICLYKAPQSKIFEILLNTRCDSNFRSMPLRNPYRSYVLRISGKEGSKKPKFLEIIGKNKNLGKEISSPHIELLRKLFPIIKHPNYSNFDKFGKLKIHTYETG